MGYTYDEAYALTNPADNDETRKNAALAIQAGTAANEIYWGHADTLTALKAKVEGHGIVPGDQYESDPTGSVSGGAASPAIGGGTPEENVPDAEVVSESGEPAPARVPVGGVDAGANPNAAVAALRKQLEDAGLTPNA